MAPIACSSSPVVRHKGWSPSLSGRRPETETLGGAKSSHLPTWRDREIGELLRLVHDTDGNVSRMNWAGCIVTRQPYAPGDWSTQG